MVSEMKITWKLKLRKKQIREKQMRNTTASIKQAFSIFRQLLSQQQVVGRQLFQKQNQTKWLS